VPLNQQYPATLNNHQQSEVVDKTHYFIARARALFDVDLDDLPVHFDLKGRAAGMYLMRKGERQIRYNPWIFARYFDSNLVDTVPHEVAHYTVEQLFGRRCVRPHGKEWQNVMLAFGREPITTCNYDLSGLPMRQVRRFSYQCNCRRHTLTTYRHNRIRRGLASYLCRHCGTTLTEAE